MYMRGCFGRRFFGRGFGHYGAPYGREEFYQRGMREGEQNADMNAFYAERMKMREAMFAERDQYSGREGP